MAKITDLPSEVRTKILHALKTCPSFHPLPILELVACSRFSKSWKTTVAEMLSKDLTESYLAKILLTEKRLSYFISELNGAYESEDEVASQCLHERQLYEQARLRLQNWGLEWRIRLLDCCLKDVISSWGQCEVSIVQDELNQAFRTRDYVLRLDLKLLSLPKRDEEPDSETSFLIGLISGSRNCYITDPDSDT